MSSTAYDVFQRQVPGPFDAAGNGKDDLYGLVHCAGSNNNTFSNQPWTVVLDGSTTNTKVIYSAQAAQLQSYTANYALVPTASLCPRRPDGGQADSGGLSSSECPLRFRPDPKEARPRLLGAATRPVLTAATNAWGRPIVTEAVSPRSTAGTPSRSERPPHGLPAPRERPRMVVSLTADASCINDCYGVTPVQDRYHLFHQALDSIAESPWPQPTGLRQCFARSQGHSR
jgi:Beta helix repeat of Inulin fructotransferase